MGKKLYIRNFPSDADEKTLFRQFGKKKVEKVDIIEKKDENGEIISRFCYLYTFWMNRKSSNCMTLSLNV